MRSILRAWAGKEEEQWGMGEEREVKGGEEKRKRERGRERERALHYSCGVSGNYINFSHRIWPMHFAITKLVM